MQLILFVKENDFLRLKLKSGNAVRIIFITSRKFWSFSDSAIVNGISELINRYEIVQYMHLYKDRQNKHRTWKTRIVSDNDNYIRGEYLLYTDKNINSIAVIVSKFWRQLKSSLVWHVMYLPLSQISDENNEWASSWKN